MVCRLQGALGMSWIPHQHTRVLRHHEELGDGQDVSGLHLQQRAENSERHTQVHGQSHPLEQLQGQGRREVQETDFSGQQAHENARRIAPRSQNRSHFLNIILNSIHPG